MAADDAADDKSTLTAPLSGVERRILASVRKGRPETSHEEQLEAAAQIAAHLPALRDPKHPAEDSPLTVKERIVRFVDMIGNIPISDTRRLSGFAANEKRDLFSFYEILYVRSSLTTYRHAIANAYGPAHPVIKYLHLNKADIAGTNDADRAQVRERQTHLIPIDFEELVETANALIDKSDLYGVAVGLVLLTGRRPYEIFKIGAIEKLDDRHVRFIGQGKLKSAPMIVLTIPVLTDADRVIAAWARVRTALRPGTKERITDLPDARAVNAVIAKPMAGITARFKLFSLYGERLTPKDLRAAYAEIAYSYFCSKRVLKNIYFHDILGHSANDERSTGTYLRFYQIGRSGDTIAQNERSLGSIAEALYADLAGITDRTARRLIEARLSDIESQLSFTSRADVRQRAGRPVDPDTLQHAAHVRSLVDRLSPSQERLVRAIANGSAFSSTKERRTVELLMERGIVERIAPREETFALTALGAEVRNQLPDWDQIDSPARV